MLPANIIDTIARYTSIEVAPSGAIVALDSPDLARYPFVYLTGHLPVRFSEAERANARRWLERGGFLMVDDHNHDIDGQFHKTVTEEITRSFGALARLPNTHALYRAFFTFEDGPPTTAHELNGWGDNIVHRYLDAVMFAGKIGVLYSNKDYSSEWNYHPQSKKFFAVDNTKFAANVIVHALTR